MLIPGCSYSYKAHAGQCKTPEQTHRAMEECGCRRCQNAIGEPELGPRMEVKTRVVPPEELDKSDLRARRYFQKEPSTEMTVIELRAKLSTYPPIEPNVLKAYFEYAFEDVDEWDELTNGERKVMTPETFQALHDWVFGKKEEPSG